ncbi:serine/threonine-protein kinase pim-1-like isoform X1 [Oryzias latipes]|uniref:serine/threonine-protein kinase pim-1-like isoform X1 n=1 Tax=Oryzias latipes TaxID=8090 RepID=UPI000CE1A80D|nr:serine/threonine-protein kinase pim-1-like isoform X1 [Oryzias latipes]
MWVSSGFRRSDNLQVAIKRIEKGFDLNTEVDEHGQFICAEVAVMQKLKDPQLQSPDKASPVVLLDWYDLKEEIILVMERPIPATDMEDYLKSRGGKIEEDEVKVGLCLHSLFVPDVLLLLLKKLPEVLMFD